MSLSFFVEPDTAPTPAPITAPKPTPNNFPVAVGHIS